MLNKTSSGWLVILLFIVGLIVRVYNFPTRINFGPEQGITLSTTAQYINGNFSLLGLPNVQRFTSSGLQLFSGPLYNYALIPIMKVFGYDPIVLSVTALVINFCTAIILYFMVKQISTDRIAFFTTFLFLFNITMIDQSLTLWILNPMPLVGLIATYLLIRHKKNYSIPIIFLLGTLCGVGISLEYFFLFTALLVGLILLLKSKSRLSSLAVFLAGIMIPLTPTVLFDLRHDWYHARVIWQYFLDTLTTPSQSKIVGYHFWQFYPLLFLAFGWILAKIYESRWWMAVGLSFLYVVFGFYIGRFSFTQAVGSPPYMNAVKLMNISKIIAKDTENNFNVVYTPDYDYRAYAIRYILTYIYHKVPMGEKEYPHAKSLYVVTTGEANITTNAPWEISSAKLTHLELIYATSDQKYFVYKMTK